MGGLTLGQLSGTRESDSAMRVMLEPVQLRTVGGRYGGTLALSLRPRSGLPAQRPG